MRKAVTLLAALLLLVASPREASARGFGGHGGFHGGGFHGAVHGGHGFSHFGFRGHFFHGFGFRGPIVAFGSGFWWGYPGYYSYPYPYPYYYPPYYSGYAAPSVIVVPPAYSESAPAPPAPSPRYYCQSAGAYYPDVQSCPEKWVLVPQTPPQ